jgi:hypothetical protein
MEIRFEPWKEVVIHEVLERTWEDWINGIISNLKAGGGGIPTLNWANGMVFQTNAFPSTEKVVEEQLKGILHWSSVSFAIKEKFEHQIVSENATINLVNVSVNEIFKELAQHLKGRSKFVQNNSKKTE